jgi:hypothetical protein
MSLVSGKHRKDEALSKNPDLCLHKAPWIIVGTVYSAVKWYETVTKTHNADYGRQKRISLAKDGIVDA